MTQRKSYNRGRPFVVGDLVTAGPEIIPGDRRFWKFDDATGVEVERVGVVFDIESWSEFPNPSHRRIWVLIGGEKVICRDQPGVELRLFEPVEGA